MITATWKFDGIFKADPQKVADEITSIGNDISPEQVLEAGRNEDSELHKCFEWDDTKAAEKYRIVQARKILTFLVIEKSDDTDVSETVKTDIRLFYKTRQTEHYKPIELVMNQTDEYQALLERAKSEAIAFKNKYSSLIEYESILDLMKCEQEF